MDRDERNRMIVESDEPAPELAERLGVSRSTVYAVRQKARLASDDGAEPEAFNQTPALNRRLLFTQETLSGLNRWGGAVHEEFQRELQDDGGVEIFTEMAVHPVAAAVLFAIEMAQRQVEWFVQPASDEERDQRAAEYVDSCLQDMRQTWDDVVSQVFTMLKYGYAVCELVYKRRLGQKPSKYTPDPARSRFDDGLIGWRGWQFISPRSMPAGDRWVFDDHGRVQAIKQQPAPDYVERVVPMEKALLFRTKVEWDNPEGTSILRPMYQPWYYATNLAEVEAIGAERMGTGIPVVYLGDNTKKSGADSDFDTAQDIVRNVRTDEQMGIVIPYAKMGAGAAENTGMLFELVSPPSRGIVNFNEVITRYEQRMAMTALAQFIFLGMTKVGTQALAETTVDVFQLAITAWSDMIAAVMNRFAIPRLMALNPFQIEALPTLDHSDVSVPNLGQVAAYVNQLVGAEVLTPDERLETYLRELGGLPEKSETEVKVTAEAAPEEEEAAELALEEFAEAFALKTIIGALAREEETGKFARGTGAALSEDEKRAAFLGEALVSGKASPAQAAQLTRLGLMERKAGKTVLTAGGRDLARVLGRKPRQGVKTLAAMLGKRRTKKRTARRAAAGAAGRKGRKGKAKKAKGGKKKKAGGKPSKEEEEEKKILEEKKDILDRLVEDGGLSPDMAEAFLLIYESENPNLAAGEYDEAIQGAMTALGLLSGEGKVTDEGKRLARALRNEDWDTIADVLGEEMTDAADALYSSDYADLLDEEFAQRLKQGGPKWERATNAYELELRRTYQAWADETARALEGVDDEREFNEKLERAVEALVAALILLGRRNLPGATALGLGDVLMSPDGIGQVSEVLAQNEALIETSLAPAIRDKVERQVGEDPMIRADRASLAAILMTFLARVGSYAGAFWGLIHWGVADRIRQRSNRARAVLDPRAKHCPQCPEYAGVYDSIEALVNTTGGMPGLWDSDCVGNCRCHVEEEVKPGVWVRVS
jgi:hypothetical protein